ncbi:MAG: DUF6291 domain-containing protein [Clostridia bacterium]|nr:DUF6291 domain-containing protein [Clostridia bacterium]
MRDSFIFYRSFYAAANTLSQRDRSKLVNAIIEYALNDKEPEVSGAAAGMFKLIRPQIDANNRRYQNGCNGGAPEGNQNARKTTKKQPKNNRTTTKKQPNDNDNENVNVNDNGNDNELYGEHNNVRLSDEEHAKLVERFPMDYNDRIEALSVYMKSTGKSYKSHYATICNWANKEKKQSASKGGRLDWI